MRNTLYILLACLSVGLMVLFASPALAVPEVPVSVSADQIADIVAAAPAVPVDLQLDLELKLVDYIDCTNDEDPHPMMQQGPSSVTEGVCGKYRQTSQGRNAFFSYRWRSDATDAPHVIVVEYPDDAKREICFLTHESQISGKANIDWSLETGVYTGNPLPLTNKMQYHTMFFWPQDKWPTIIVANWIRQGAPAAASRIWIYRVVGDHLPAMKVTDPDPQNPRLIGDLYNWSLVPVHHIFGRQNRATAFKHIVEYYKYLGNNLVAWPVVSNNSWGFRCHIDGWDGDDEDDELEGILTACDEQDMKFIASFEIGKGFKINGKNYTDDKDAFYVGLLAGFDNFIERYGHHPSLYGICSGTPDFGQPYGQALVDLLVELGKLEDFTRHIKEKKPDLQIMTFIGARDLHKQYFNDNWGVLERWEKSGDKLEDHLADEVLKLWRQWGRDPQKLGVVDGLTLVYQYQPDDHGIYDSYSQNPRSMMYYDIANSKPVSDNIDTRAVMIWNTFYESWLGLHPNVNYWYRKLWVAPDFNASEPYASVSWSRAMAHRDRNVMIAGAWNRKAGGHEASLRKFAKAYRQLPPAEMQDVVTVGGDAVKVRKVYWAGKTYVSVLSVSPFTELVELAIGASSKPIELAPFQMKTVVLDGDTGVSARMRNSQQYTEYVKHRLMKFNHLAAKLKAVEPEAVADKYTAHAQRAAYALRSNDVHAADMILGYGLEAELELRKSIIHPDVYVAGKCSSGPSADASLDDWPATALDIKADDGSFISTHLYFANSWSGSDDLSARVRACYDSEKLYIGVDIRDELLTPKDVVDIWLSKENYRNWRENSQKVDGLSINHPYPADGPASSDKNGVSWTIRPTENGYFYYVAVDLAKLELSAGDDVGFLVSVSDYDEPDNVNKAGWAKSTRMMIPHRETFANWSDARNCLLLKLGQ